MDEKFIFRRILLYSRIHIYKSKRFRLSNHYMLSSFTVNIKMQLSVSLILLSIGLCVCEEIRREIFQENIPSIVDPNYRQKTLTIYKLEDNSTRINIFSYIEKIDLKKKLIKKTADNIYITPLSFQRIYRCFTGEDFHCNFEAEDKSYYQVRKFFEGSTPFHATIVSQSLKDLKQKIFRGIYIDSKEYKYLVSTASEIMRTAEI